MENKTILEKAIERGIKNGWLNLPTDKIRKIILIEKDKKLYLEVVWKGKVKAADSEWFVFSGVENIIFSYNFAWALNFLLEDLGAWCDKGKEPLKFIERLI